MNGCGKSIWGAKRSLISGHGFGRGLRQPAALHLHFMRRLPGANDHFAHTPHRLRIGGHHADGAQVVQDVFRRDGLSANA